MNRRLKFLKLKVVFSHDKNYKIPLRLDVLDAVSYVYNIPKSELCYVTNYHSFIKIRKSYRNGREYMHNPTERDIVFKWINIPNVRKLLEKLPNDNALVQYVPIIKEVLISNNVMYYEELSRWKKWLKR